MLKDIYFRLIDPQRIIGRIRDGRNDLKSAIDKGTPISIEQKKEIMDFWHPYKQSLVERLSFDIRWFDVYNTTNEGHDLKLYIPDSYFYSVIDTFFNDAIRCKYIDDKNLYDLYFYDVNMPKTICRKEGQVYVDGKYHIISKESAIKLCKDAGRVIIKPTIDACAGTGISKWICGKDSDELLVKKLDESNNLIIQELINQHECLAKFNDSCVNTMRIVTLYYEGEVHVVTSVVIMGGKGALTNHLHGGGLICGINPNGSLNSIAFDGALNKYVTHPVGGMNFGECKIVNYYKCIDLVKTLAPRLLGFSRLSAWDLTIDENGEPLLIEVNLSWGGVVQKAAGPIFGEMTEDILKLIHKNS